MKYLAWLAIYGCIGLTIGLIVLALTGQTDHPTIFFRGLIVIPFVLFCAIRELRRAKAKETADQLKKQIDKIIQKGE